MAFYSIRKNAAVIVTLGEGVFNNLADELNGVSNEHYINNSSKSPFVW